ncbi:phosphatidylserine/phosphatidylglycerophosphate/cardiolipin synthase family protein [Candidatus Nomurabacteria bacterium]|nr:phosphatidylserine/phosphatidylglycerophosphate/cardiolipin synthase family protein [Candidatus Nomurabacteria bacterium]
MAKPSPRGGGGAIRRAYDSGQSYHALRACLIQGSAGNESELFGIMTTTMRYKFFASSYSTWQAMFEAIEGAKESIYLEMYIFNDDMRRFDFLNLLKEKAKRGLRVRIVLDSFGSSELSKNAVTELKNSGAEVYFFSRFLHRIHRKILVVDEELAFIGGVNFHQVARRWDDLAVRVRGKLVLSIISSFARVYAECGGKDPRVLAQNKKFFLPKTRTWLIENFPISKSFVLKKIYKKNISKAEESIIFITPYFMPKHWLIGALHQAVLRGVRVEVLVPKKSNHFLPDRIAYFFMFKLSKLGVNFFLLPRMNHAKAMIIDRSEAILGSHNLDFLSFELNSEVGIFFKNKKAVEELKEIMEGWKKGAVLFDHGAFKPTFFDYIFFPVIRLFFRII